MKRILAFIGLKLAEIGGFVAVCYWFWWVGMTFEKWKYSDSYDLFVTPWYLQIVLGFAIHLAIILLIFGFRLICYGIYQLIKFNWQLTQRWFK